MQAQKCVTPQTRMSARKQMSAAESDASFNLVPALRDCLSPGIIVVSQRGQICSCSPEAARFLALSTAEMVSQPVSVLPPPLQVFVNEAVFTPEKNAAAELKITLANQLQRTLHAQATPLCSATGESTVVITLSDLSGIVHIQQNLERLDRLATAGTLAAGMAHEVKNALVAVKTFVDLLLEKNKDAELATLVGREMDRVNKIIRQLLKFGSASRPVRDPVRVHDVLDHSLRMVKHQLDGKLISLRRDFKATSDTVAGDNHQLEQVFVNLFLNAVDATGTNGSLTVETEFISAAPPEIAAPSYVGRPHVCIRVADTGAGIPEEHLNQMFEPFFTTKNHGTGLGLPITRRIIQEHHGRITVESQPNKGTTFSIILPAAPPPA